MTYFLVTYRGKNIQDEPVVNGVVKFEDVADALRRMEDQINNGELVSLFQGDMIFDRS